MDIECRRMARTGEPVLIRYPGHSAAEVCAFPVQRQKTATFKTRQVELAIAKRRNATRLKSIDRTGNHDFVTLFV